MIEIPAALAPLASYNQFILWVMSNGKKLPVDPRTAAVGDAHDSTLWLSAEEAMAAAAVFGPQYGIAFVFTNKDPFFFVDIDKCLQPDNTWSPLAMDLMSRFNGAAVEVSQSGRGLHIFGTGLAPEHSKKNIALGIEFYTEGRFVALTGTNAIGDASLDCTPALEGITRDYFAPKGSAESMDWTDGPVAEWTGPEDDEELIAKACAASGAGAVFSGKATFTDLWTGNEDALANSYPDLDGGGRTYDGSSADAALAQHLAFWTGKDCERIKRLMLISGLVRDKWDREDYLVRTILNAVSMGGDVYSVGHVDSTVPDSYGAVKLRANSDAQRAYAEGIRATKMAEAQEDSDVCERLANIGSAKQWIDNQHKTPAELAAMVTPVAKAAGPLARKAEIVSGYQYLGATQQIEYFNGCVYIQDAHRVLAPNGALLKAEQFNATYGGYTFQMDESGDKTTRKAWEAFTESQVVRYPKAEGTCFRPGVAPGSLIDIDGRVMVNTYIPITTPRMAGDIRPFIDHLNKLLPVERDREILLAYMAACVQYKGVKFQWAPLVQGAEGNGKTLLTRCVAFAIGDKYTHFPPANEMSEKFNAWLFDKLFIGIEDVFVSEQRKEVLEVLKPMITNNKLAKRAMQQDQVTADVCANFMLNSNHKDAIRKTRTDRRFAVFYTAQQSDEDLVRDGMDGLYFPRLYKWLNDGGYAIVSDYLHEYRIPDELNPATLCHRAPETSSTMEAIISSMGGIEQEIMEAIEEGRPGFAGGWVSSVAVDRLLQASRSNKAVPHNKRRDLLRTLGYDWHPALHNGRVNNPIPLDDNKKPRLFVRKGHINLNIKNAGDVAKAYVDAQMMGGGEVFNHQEARA